MDFARYIARRYLRSRRHSRFLSRGSVTAIAGITIGVAVLNITLAVMNGFHTEMRRTFVENMPMISVITSRAEGFTDLGATLDAIGGDEEVAGVAPFVRQEAILTASRKYGPPRPKGVVIWGIAPDLVESVQPLEKYLLPGPGVLDELDTGETPHTIIGADLANNLYVAIGDTVILTAPSGELELDNIKAESRPFLVAGFFETGMYEFDSRFVYIHIDAAREFLGYGENGASLVGVKVTDLMRAGFVSDRLDTLLGREYYATDWMTLNQNLFQWIQMEKVIMVVLLGMIILIAGFNIIGILTMMVGERRREIGILLAMGTPRRQIMGVFVLNGLQLGSVGVALGTLLGLGGIAFLHFYGISLPGDVYFVESVPVLAQWTDFLLVTGMTFGIALVAALWPAWEASNLKPMDIIRYT
nr:ABC transporter permease [Candidatus Krumholzibacteria bacterium]